MKRKRDVITESRTDAEILYTLYDFPVNMLSEGNTDYQDDAVFDMRFGIFPDSGVIQLMELVPENLIYIDTHSNAVGGVWKRQHEALAKLISEEKPRTVLEIGGGTGVLERIYREKYGSIDMWTIIDPAPNPTDTEAHFIKGYFPKDIPKGIEFDIIVHSHVWEHAHSPKRFIEELSKLIQRKGKMIFSVPDLRCLLEQKKTSIINFEHTVYLTDIYIEYLLNNNSFVVEEKEYFENHSIIYSVTKHKCDKTELDGAFLYRKNKKLFNEYIKTHIESVHAVNDKMSKLDNSEIYMFGGHIATQFYVAFGLRIDKIKCCIDNDSCKWGKRVAGTDMKILSPGILINVKEPVVILPSGPYTNEIKNQILQEINKDALFIEI